MLAGRDIIAALMIFQQFRQIRSTIHQAQRFRDIVGVLLKYGYGDMASRLGLPSAARVPWRRLRERQAEIELRSAPVRLRQACEELGPTFVKLGQLLASRTRVLPSEFIDELIRLQDQVPALPFEEIRRLIEESLRRPLAEVFTSIDEVPLGSASIAQVHRAVLLTGDAVVVKVQRPGIAKVIEEDLGILRHLAELAERHLEAWRSFRLVATVDELARTLQKELDFGREAAHLDRFAWQFREEATLYLPRVYPDLTTSLVLVMEYVPGIKASGLAELSAAGVDLAETARRIADLVMKQMFVHGFFHADPHPGNIHIMADQRVCFLDFGMMGFLDRRTREAFADLAWGIAERNQRTTAAALLRLTAAEAEPEHHAFESDVADFMHQHFYKSAGEIQFSQLVGDLLQLTRVHGLLLPPDLVVMFKALGQTEELVRRLNPTHDLVAQAAPFIRDVRLERLRPRRLWDEWSTVGRDAAELVRDLPAELRRLMSQFKRGQGRLHFYHEGLEPALQTMDRVSNRLAFAAVLAALIIGSSIIVHARVPPVWNGVSVLGLAGYVCAGFMGFWLLLAILRHGRM